MITLRREARGTRCVAAALALTAICAACGGGAGGEAGPGSGDAASQPRADMGPTDARDAAEAPDRGGRDGPVPPTDGGPSDGPAPMEGGPDALTDAAPDATFTPDVGPAGDASPPIADAFVPPPDAAPPPPPPLITEFMALNEDTLADEDGDHPDYIELYNPGDAPFFLGGWHLTDDPEDPRKWILPGVTLDAHRYLVVFASGKDRRPAEGPLHTNFRLDGDGEYLALVSPDGVVVQAFEDVPAQREDVAFGLPAEVDRFPLVSADAPARLGFGPQPGLEQPEADDATFTDVRAAVGYDRTRLPEAPFVLTDSVASFGDVQGDGGWTYGYRDLNTGPDYAFIPFAPGMFNGNVWHLPGDPPHTELSRMGGHPNGRLQGGVHWAIRRWTASGPGRVRVRGLMGTYGIGGDGVVCRVLVDGVEVVAKRVENERKRYEVVVDAVPGTTVDLAIDPGIDGDAASDRTLFTGRVELWDAAADDPGGKVADSATEWSATGTQGALDWFLGYWQRGGDADGVYAVWPEDEFVAFPRDEGAFGPSDFWTGTGWDWPSGDPPWTMAELEFMHPNGDDTPMGEQWVIRRWRSPVAGDLLIRWRVNKIQNGGSGVTGHVLHNGTPLDSATITGADISGTERFVVAYGVMGGDVLDFALDPTGRNGSHDAGGDLSQISAEVWPLGSPGPYIRTDVGRAAGDASEAVLRIPFEVDDPTAFDHLRLSVRYDDGFEAFLNGRSAARDNLPAVTDRDAEDALEPRVFDLTDGLPALQAGPNLLAFRLAQGPVDDGRMLLAPTLEGIRVRMNPATAGFLALPTPGADNLAPDVDLPPYIEVLDPWPAVRAGDPITIRARVEPGTAPVERVTVTTRVMFGPEETSDLFDVGDGTWQGVVFPPAFPGDLVRFRVEVVDGLGQRARAPRFEDSLESEPWFGTVIEDLGVETNLPVLHWYTGRLDAAASDQGTRGVVYWNGELYSNVAFSLHGQSSRGFPKHSYNLDFSSDHRFRVRGEFGRVKDVNLLSNYADKSKLRNTLAWETYRDADADHHLAFPVRVQLNGQFFGVYDMVEDADDRWLERLGRNPEGALYKMYDNFQNPAAAEKKTRKDEGKADLEAFMAGLNAGGDDLRRFLYDEVNIAAMVNFLAAMILTSSTDCCHKNYYAYRDTGVTDQWWFMIWDLDLSFGRNWTGNYFDDRMYPQNPMFVGGNSRLTGALFALPEFQEMYYRRLRTLMDTLLQPPDTPPELLHYETRIDALVEEIGADGDLDTNTWPSWGEPQTFAQAVRALREDYLAQRRAFVYGTWMQEVGGPLPMPVEPAVLIDEADPSPDAPERAYLRLSNLTGSPVDVSNWRVSGAGVSMHLEPGAVIPTGGALYLVADVPAFKEREAPPHGGMGLFVLGNWTGVLSPDGELPTITDPTGFQVFP
ncbi:CotH kinase family protein [Myxococcota bacterium]|nr:CotH kinase family protein [Myxococcota bacterium]